MVGLVAAITHVPGTRQQLLFEVRAGLGGIPHEVINDPNREGVWPTSRRAWLRILEIAEATGASHGLLIQDDMVPVRGFRDGALAAIEANPREVICFVCLRPALVRLAREAGSSWAIAEDAASGAVAMPVPTIREFLGWVDANIPAAYPHDDRRITAFIVATGRTVWLTMPSLVEHRAATESLLGHSGGRYRTVVWPADDARAVDWTRGLDRPVRRPIRLPPDVRRLLG